MTTRPVGPALLVLLACGALGCPDPEACRPGDAPTLELGTGEAAFEPLRGELPEVPLVMGPQGGFHTFIGFEATYLEAEDLLLGTMRGYIGGELLAETSPWVNLRCNRETETLQGWGSLLIWPGEPAELYGQQATIEVLLTDVEQRTVEASADVLIVEP